MSMCTDRHIQAIHEYHIKAEDPVVTCLSPRGNEEKKKLYILLFVDSFSLTPCSIFQPLHEPCHEKYSFRITRGHALK